MLVRSDPINDSFLPLERVLSVIREGRFEDLKVTFSQDGKKTLFYVVSAKTTDSKLCTDLLRLLTEYLQE